ncbi:MAG TPA: hypothetical protein VD866_11400 [Urbifossiella sp.]|nr:hypothetical protein [Urbifossiella sp.]
MYRTLFALIGVPVGGVIGLAGGAMIGHLFDDPHAGHMTRGVMGMLGGMVMALPGAAAGALGGSALGRLRDARGEARAARSVAPERRAEVLVQHRRDQRWATAGVLAAGGCLAAVGFGLDVLTRLAPPVPFFLVGGVVGVIAGWVGYLILTGRVRHPVPVGTLAAGFVGTAAVYAASGGGMPVVLAFILAFPTASWIGYGGAHLLVFLAGRAARAGEPTPPVVPPHP